MKLALCHSMQFAEKAKEVQAWFATRGIEAYPSSFNEAFIGLSDDAKERLKLECKYNNDAIREHWSMIEKCDAVLVLNYDKNGVTGYIGGNSFLEMGFAYILKKPLYLLYPIPEIPYYDSEIKAMRPTILSGALEKLLKA